MTVSTTIKNINSSVPKIIITNLMGYLRFLPTPEFYRDSIINISVGMSIEPKKLYEKKQKIRLLLSLIIILAILDNLMYSCGREYICPCVNVYMNTL